MEEFRPLIADRLVITLINRKQVQPDGFLPREGGAVEMTEATRKEVVTAWRDRKKDQVTHQLLQQSMLIGDLPHIQAKILARQIRGDIDQYVPCTLK
jgi:CRISPR-associated protein Cas1